MKTAAHPMVMLVDDSAIDNFIGREMIEGSRYAEKVVTYSTIAAALEHLSRLERPENFLEPIPSLIFLGVNSSFMMSLVFLEKFERLSSRIKDTCKVVILSGTADLTELSESIQDPHILCFLNKPLLKRNLEEAEQLLTMSKEKKLTLV